MVQAGSRRYGSEAGAKTWPGVGRINKHSPGSVIEGVLQERILNPKYFTHVERFTKLPQVRATGDQAWTVEALRITHMELGLLAGVNSADGDITFRAGGGINVETIANDGDNDIIGAHLDTNQSQLLSADNRNWSSTLRPLFYVNLVTGPIANDIDNCIIMQGFKLTAVFVTATDADQFFFRYENDVNGGRWQAVTSNNGTDTATDTGIVVEFDTSYRLMIEVDRDRIPHYYINDVEVATGASEAGTVALRDLATFEFYHGIELDGDGLDKAYALRSALYSQLLA